MRTYGRELTDCKPGCLTESARLVGPEPVCPGSTAPQRAWCTEHCSGQETVAEPLWASCKMGITALLHPCYSVDQRRS